MLVLDWPFLDTLQMGALAALFISFGTDALTRRDRMMGWLSITCLLVGLRHAVLALGSHPSFNPDLVDRAQSLLVSFGFIALCMALARLFPKYIPRAFPGWIALGMVTNLARNLFLAHPSQLDQWLHHLTNLNYLVGCGALITWILAARQDGDPMGRHLFLGFLGVTIPVVVEIAALSLFDQKVRLSGFSIMFLAMAIGTSWQWLVVHAMEGQITQAESEVEVWRSLVPGTAFRTDLPSKAMEDLFGPDWASKVKLQTELTLSGSDGFGYRIHSRELSEASRLGWYERDEATQPGLQGFLAGWTVALGLDDPNASIQIQAMLRAWGAEIQIWGTLPPREGPYPSVLLWGREPSILAVWREGDLLRRRPRWIQIGGPVTEGPHVRLESHVSEGQLKQVLEDLLSRR